MLIGLFSYTVISTWEKPKTSSDLETEAALTQEVEFYPSTPTAITQNGAVQP